MWPLHHLQQSTISNRTRHILKEIKMSIGQFPTNEKFYSSIREYVQLLLTFISHMLKGNGQINTMSQSATPSSEISLPFR